MTVDARRGTVVRKPAMTLLDTLFVIMSAATIVMFVIWLASAVAGKSIELNLPSPIEKVVSGIWGWLISAAGSVMLRLLGGKPRGQYLPWILGVALFLLASVVMSSRLFSEAPETGEFSVTDFDVNRVAPSCEGPSPAPAPVPIVLDNGLYNLSLLVNARASASAPLQGYPHRHRIEHLNDGWYNNCRSWIADQMPAVASINLGAVYEVFGVRMGSEHEAMHRGRAASQFKIEVSNPGAWRSVYTHSGAPIQGTTEIFFDKPVLAQFVRLQIQAADHHQVRIDELEVMGRKPGKTKQEQAPNPTTPADA